MSTISRAGPGASFAHRCKGKILGPASVPLQVDQQGIAWEMKQLGLELTRMWDTDHTMPHQLPCYLSNTKCLSSNMYLYPYLVGSGFLEEHDWHRSLSMHSENFKLQGRCVAKQLSHHLRYLQFHLWSSFLLISVLGGSNWWRPPT